MTIKNRFRCFMSMALIATQAVHSGEVLNDIHIDHAFRYDDVNDEWEIVIHGNDGDPDLSPDEAVLIVVDDSFPSGGRFSRPISNDWDFVGVGPNEDFWIIPQIEPEGDLIYPGWRAEGLFAEYLNDDPRVGVSGEAVSASYVKISLEGVAYSGLGEGHFSFWKIIFGTTTPLPWMVSSDGYSVDDGYFFTGHGHDNMGFSDPGVYRVDYKASGFLDNMLVDPGGEEDPYLVGTNPVTSPIQSFYYAVGTFAEWKATHYEPHELVDDDPLDSIPEVASIDSDTDKDGVTLLLEYAFNLIPVQADLKTLTPGTGTEGLPVGYLDDSGEDSLLGIEFVRRRAEGSPRLTYIPEFSSTLNSGWAEILTETVTPIDSVWERVRVVDSPPLGEEGTRFGRVRVVLE